MAPLCSEKFYLLLFWSRLVHAAARCMLPSLRSAPYPALCPSERRRPVGDMQAVSCGARSRQYSRLLPASSSQPRSIAQRPRSGPMGRVHTCMQAFYKRPRHASKTPSVASLLRPCLIINTRCRAWLDQLSTNYSKTSTRRLR